MDREISSTMSSLFKTDKCSPLVVYIVLVLVTAVTLFNTNGLMKKLQNFKINNIFTIHARYEVALLLVLVVVLFGYYYYNELHNKITFNVEEDDIIALIIVILR